MDEVAIMKLQYTKLLYKVNWLLIYLQLESLKEFCHFITAPTKQISRYRANKRGSRSI